MQALKRHHAAECETGTDNETEPTSLTSSSTSSQSSVTASTDNDQPRKLKRRRLADPTLKFQEELLGTLRQDIKSRDEHQRATDERLRSFMESSKQQGDEICNILKGLVEVERDRRLAREMSYEI